MIMIWFNSRLKNTQIGAEKRISVILLDLSVKTNKTRLLDLTNEILLAGLKNEWSCVGLGGWSPIA